MIGSVWITADGGRESGRITAERRSIRRTAGRRQEHGRSTAGEYRADDRIGVDHGRRQAGERADYGGKAEYTADGR